VKIKLSENLGTTHADLLNSVGHEAHRVYEQGLSGEKDNTVWEHVCRTGQFFITMDMDFSDVRKYPPGSHAGILLLRPRSKSRSAALEVLRRVLSERDLESFSGCLAVADLRRTRLRRSHTAV
jgi:predicted nuclease of predicted toxin-antitoxin system